MGLAGTVIGILPEDHDLDRFKRGQVKRGQPGAARRIDRLASGFLGFEKAAKLP